MSSTPQEQYEQLAEETEVDASGFGGSLKKFFADPRGFVVTILASWVVTNLFIRPFQYSVAILELGWENILSSYDSGMKEALGNAGTGVYQSVVGTQTDPGAIWSVYLNIAEGLRSAGLAGPIVGTVTVLIMLSIVVTLSYLGARIAFNLAGGVLVS